MEEKTLSHGAWVRLIGQFFDSAFPSGGYAHSTGLEGLIQMGVIENKEDLLEFTKSQLLPNLQYGDLPVLRLTQQAYREDKFDQISVLDELSWATKGTKELRLSSSRIGKQLYFLIGKIWETDEEFQAQWIFSQSQLNYFQQGAVLGVFCGIKNVPTEVALTAYAFQLVQSWGQAAIKLLHLGPMQSQQYMAQAGEWIDGAVAGSLTVTIDAIGTFSPAWDIASALHERANARLFIS
jgi:urease accessory protein